MIPSFQMISSLPNKREPDFVTKKKNFRQQTRKVYLNQYFSKKRAEHFGWCHEEYLLKSNEKIFEIYEDVQIDKPISVQSQKFFNQDLSPKYNQDYFKNVALMQKFLSLNQEIELDANSLQNPYNFKYKSLYDFLIDVIKQSLDQTFFQKFEKSQVFVTHFDSLKISIYKKLVQEIQIFLVEFYDFDSDFSKNESVSKIFLQETYRKLLFQLENFLFIENLETEQDKKWPDIKIQGQLCFLIKILIEITYHDLPISTENFLDRMVLKSSQVEEKYREIFQNCQNQIEDNSFSVTKHLVDQTILLQRLNYLIVFGHAQVNSSIEEDQKSEKRRKCRQIRLIIRLLRNIAINIGSEVLFESGIINELKFVLNEPYFKVNIGKRKRNHQKQNEIPELHLRIQSFILDVFEMIKSEKGLNYISEMESLNFAFETLVKVTEIKGQIQNQFQQENSPISLNQQVILIDSKHQDQIIDINESEQTEQTLEHLGLKNSYYGLMKLASKCISSIHFHLEIGEILFQRQFQSQDQPTENRYKVKLRNIFQYSQQNVLEEYPEGRDLLKRWKFIHN